MAPLAPNLLEILIDMLREALADAVRQRHSDVHLCNLGSQPQKAHHFLGDARKAEAEICTLFSDHCLKSEEMIAPCVRFQSCGQACV